MPVPTLNRVISGLHRNRTWGAEAVRVQIPGTYVDRRAADAERPRSERFPVGELVMIAPQNGMRTWPPWVWPQGVYVHFLGGGLFGEGGRVIDEQTEIGIGDGLVNRFPFRRRIQSG